MLTSMERTEAHGVGRPGHIGGMGLFVALKEAFLFWAILAGSILWVYTQLHT